MNMDLDITGKVGIRNAYQLLRQEYELAYLAHLRADLENDIVHTSGYAEGLARAIEIVKLNITNSD